jgi:putative membrane protein
MTTAGAPAVVQRSAAVGHRIAVVAGATAILAQIIWVLVPEDARDAVTISSVALFAVASLSHAAASRGTSWAARYALIAVGAGWIAEAIGTTTGWPFGAYDYTDSLGPKLGPVPLVIPLAWLMMSYPVLLAARAVAVSRLVQTCYAAALLTSWDLFLDPQMVAEGHWVWFDPTPALPGIPGIPAQNFVGWFLVGLVLFGAAAWLLPQRASDDDRVPAAMLLWVFASNVMANALFWGRPAVALIGGLAMGLLLLPWLRTGVSARRFWLRS